MVYAVCHCSADYFAHHALQGLPVSRIDHCFMILGLAVRNPMDKIVKAFETGNWQHALDTIAIVVGLGTMLGKMMAESGGAERIANTLIGWFGEKYIHWAMMCVAIIVGLPVFFEVGSYLLIPIAFNVAKRTRNRYC